MSNYDNYPYSEEEEKFNEQFNSFAGVVVGVWVFFVIVKPLINYFHLF